jgi:hypothetical protein
MQNLNKVWSQNQALTSLRHLFPFPTEEKISEAFGKNIGEK